MSTPPAWPPPPPPPPPGVPPGAPPSGAPPVYGAPPYPPPKKKASPAVVLAIIAGIVCCAGPAFLGIIAAIAIPGFLRARMGANEASAITRMRTMTSAQMTWAALHEGRFTEPSCLADPPSCGDTSGTTYVTPDAGLMETRSGYTFGFVLRPPADDDSAPGGFAYWGSPSTPGSTGLRRFCVEETGVVLQYDAIDAPWIDPSAEQPRCPEDGRPVG